MRLIIMGTGPFAVPMFEAVLAKGHEVPIVVTRPSRPARGRKQAPPNPMLEAGQAAGIEVWAPESINTPEAIEQLRSYDADLMLVCDYGQILSRDALGSVRLGGINLHGSLLPKYRGAAPVQWAVINGDTTTGITVIHMTPKLDGGPALVQVESTIEPHETAEALESRLAVIGAPAVLKAIDMLEQWDGESEIGELQNPEAVTKAPRLTKSHGVIDWTKCAADIVNNHRGVQPWPGSFTIWNRGKQPMRLIVSSLEYAALDKQGSPGEVVIADKQDLVVACGSGGIRLREIQPAGKRVMKVEEFMRGYQLNPGVRFE